MGKKARKTRWKALSIEEPRSDCSSPVFDSSKSYSNKARYNGAQAGSGAHHKYTSSHSTPTHHRDRWALQKDQNTSTRSNSTCSDTKITFNEDEYTKITTPRQDVLFKKGYLSKPKPYLQRPLTSAGTSTGDGTPDHQSADGADFPENDLDGFPYPNVFPPYVNYESSAPVILYDNFGNSVVYYPPPGLPAQAYHPDNADIPSKKRYSVDSAASQSTTPNNEANESASEPEVFEGAKAFPTDVAEAGETPATQPDTNTTDEESTKHKYRVDAEEFVPRGFVPNYNFMPVCPEFFGGHFVILPPSLPPFSNFYPVPAVEPTEQQIEPETNEGGQGIDIQKIVSKLEQAAQEQNLRDETLEGEKQNDEQETETVEVNDEIVVETVEQPTIVETIEVLTEKSPEAPLEKSPDKPLDKSPEKSVESKPEINSEPVQKYSDRLKSNSTVTKQIKPVPKAPRVPRISNPPASVANNPQKTCPRLHRQSSKSSSSSGHGKGSSGPEIPSRCVNVPKHPPKVETIKHQKNTTSDLNNCDVVSGAKQPEVATSDSWVSVNSRKKRKNPKNQTNENLSDSSDVVENLNHPEVPPTPPTPVEVPPTQPEIETTIKITGSIKKSPKENKNKTVAPKKGTKKRVLVTDECLGALNTPQETVCKPEIIEEPEIIEAPEQKLIVEPKKPKKKRNKPKVDISCTLTDSDLNISISSDSLGLLDTSGHSSDPADVSEVELELEKMIQRGLYANLEQKLGKTDSFLGNLNNSNPFNSLFSPPKLPNMVFPQIRVPKTQVEPPKVPKPEPEPEVKLSVTEAVKKWIDKTRETTPEVEIFRKPEEIREEMLTKVLEEDLEEAQEATSYRSRSNSIDIMEYWDDELHSGGPGPQPEAAEDALEVYESVYGTSNDFQRIQSEVGHSVRGRLFGGQNRSNSLPYRAICCSVM